MKMTALLAVTTSLLLAPNAGRADAPQITDPAGDANGGLVELGDTRPASYDPGDLLQVRLATSYVTVPVGADGIDYRATGLKVAFTTSAPVGETTVPMSIRLLFDVGGCGERIDVYVYGPVPGGTHPADRTVEWWQTDEGSGCPDAPPAGSTRIAPPWVLSAAWSELRIDAPYATMTPAQREHLAPGNALSGLKAVTSVYAGVAVEQDEARAWFPWFDLAGGNGHFVIGSDVPADVACTRQCP